MPVTNVASRGGQGSCWDRVKMGFKTGAAVGLASGLLFGGYASLR